MGKTVSWGLTSLIHDKIKEKCCVRFPFHCWTLRFSECYWCWDMQIKHLKLPWKRYLNILPIPSCSLFLGQSSILLAFSFSSAISLSAFLFSAFWRDMTSLSSCTLTLDLKLGKHLWEEMHNSAWKISQRIIWECKNDLPTLHFQHEVPALLL